MGKTCQLQNQIAVHKMETHKLGKNQSLWRLFSETGKEFQKQVFFKLPFNNTSILLYFLAQWTILCKYVNKVDCLLIIL